MCLLSAKSHTSLYDINACISGVEAIHRYDEGAIRDVEEWELEERAISAFWLAVQLDRAFEIGSGVAERFVDQLKRRGQIPKTIQDVEEAAVYLLKLLKGKSFYYRHAPTQQMDLERQWIEEEFDGSSKLKRRYQRSSRR